MASPGSPGDQKIRGWKEWLIDTTTVVDFLMKSTGCTKAEALLLLEMNNIQMMFRRLGGELTDLCRSLDHLADVTGRDGDEPWKGGK